MQEYTLADFLATLDETGRSVAEAIHNHIDSHYPEYKPFDIRPNNKTLNEWTLNFRKKPKVGKALCTLYSNDSKLSMRVVFLGFMDLELLLRQNEFNEKIRRFMLLDICKKCKSKCDYEYRKYFYVHGRLIASSRPYCASKEYTTEYAEINDISKDDINDILHLIDLQTKHMTQDPREIRGSGYLETSRKRCGEIETISLDRTELDIDNFEQSDYADPKKLDKYASIYHLTPMGEHDGLWYYHDDIAVCGEKGDDYCHTTVPEGRYASVTINDPFTFSAWRVWSYIAKWVYENNTDIHPVNLGGTSAPYFVRFYRQDGSQYMSVYVPIE